MKKQIIQTFRNLEMMKMISKDAKEFNIDISDFEKGINVINQIKSPKILIDIKSAKERSITICQ